MSGKFKAMLILTLVLSIVSLLWGLFDIYKIYTDLQAVLHIEKAGLVMAVGYVFIILFHISALLFLYMHIRSLKALKGLRISSLILGIISLFSIGIEKVMYDEVGREFYLEFPVPGEVNFLYACLGVNVLFSIVMIYFLYRTLLLPRNSEASAGIKDERIFVLAQFTGMVSGITGILLTLSLIAREIPAVRFQMYLPFYILFLVPYALVVIYWLSLKYREKISNWYDEKQWKDILKASLTTLILSVPGLALLIFIGKPLSFYWYPYYLFLALLLFSGSTLYFFRDV